MWRPGKLGQRHVRVTTPTGILTYGQYPVTLLMITEHTHSLTLPLFLLFLSGKPTNSHIDQNWWQHPTPTSVHHVQQVSKHYHCSVSTSNMNYTNSFFSYPIIVMHVNNTPSQQYQTQNIDIYINSLSSNTASYFNSPQQTQSAPSIDWLNNRRW